MRVARPTPRAANKLIPKDFLGGPVQRIAFLIPQAHKPIVCEVELVNEDAADQQPSEKRQNSLGEPVALGRVSAVATNLP
jgi:hypothetical protein